MKPELTLGGSHADARGVLRFCNNFDMSAVRRFYTIANSVEQPMRGWIGHRRETKWFFPLKGSTTVVVEPMDGSSAENRGGVEEFALESDSPSVLEVPPGNWFCLRQDGKSEVMIFSDCSLEESENDDVRRPL